MLLNCGVGKKKTLESPLQARRSSQSILKAINSEYTLQDVEAETPLDVKNRLIGKDPEAGKD